MEQSSAISAAGARGLMQIMPETAQYLMGAAYFPRQRLHEPASNLAVGQRYLQTLAGLDGIDGNLMKMLASYNAGPGNVQHWSETMHDQNDPLMFIETIPVTETRNFVPLSSGTPSRIIAPGTWRRYQLKSSPPRDCSTETTFSGPQTSVAAVRIASITSTSLTTGGTPRT